MKMMSMVAVAAGLFIAANLSGAMSTMIDYGTVAWQRIGGWVEENVPLEDELAVLELNVKKLDSEIEANAKLVAKFDVELEQDVRQLKLRESAQKELSDGLEALGQKYVTMVDGDRRQQVSATLARGTEHLKIRAQTLAAQREALARKQESFEKLKLGIEQQKHDRSLMKSEVERLRAEYTTMKVQGQLDQPALLGTTSDKVHQLKDRLEKKLLTQQKLHEMNSGDIESEIGQLNDDAQEFDLAELRSVLSSF